HRHLTSTTFITSIDDLGPTPPPSALPAHPKPAGVVPALRERVPIIVNPQNICHFVRVPFSRDSQVSMASIHSLAKTEVDGSNLFCCRGPLWSFLEHELHEGFLVVDSKGSVVFFLNTNRGHRLPAQRPATHRTRVRA